MRTFRFAHWLVRCKHQRRCSQARWENVSFRDVKIKIPDRNRDKGMWVTSRTGIRGLRILEDLRKRSELSSCLRTRESRFRPGRGQTTLCATVARALIGLRADDVKAASRERLILSLSPSCPKIFKVRKVNKRFAPEPISYFRIPIYVYEYFYEHYVYFTYPYHGYVTIAVT